MHIGIGLNLHLIPGLSEGLLSECDLSPAGVMVLTGTIGEVRRGSTLLVSPTQGTYRPTGSCTPHIYLLMASDSAKYLALDSVDSSQTAPMPWVSQHDGNRTVHASLQPHWPWCSAEAEACVVSTITHLPLRPSCWETLQACHKIWPKTSSNPRKTFPLTLVEFESNLWSPVSLCWYYVLFSLIIKK